MEMFTGLRFVSKPAERTLEGKRRRREEEGEQMEEGLRRKRYQAIGCRGERGMEVMIAERGV